MKTTPTIALVTGASSGIGRATVLTLLRQRYVVYAAARRTDAMRDLQAAGAHLLYLDLTDADSIARAVETIHTEAGPVDVLVNNAGYGAYGALEDMPLDEARRQFEVNVFGLADLTRRVLPAMRERRSGRIINVGSIGGRTWSLFGTWYQATKFALEGFSDCLRNELRPFGIQVVLIRPGSIKTEWAQLAANNLMAVSGNGPYGAMARAAARFYVETDQRQGADPQVIANAIWQAVSARRPRARYTAPAAARAVIGLRWLLPDSLFDRLWGSFFGIPKTT